LHRHCVLRRKLKKGRSSIQYLHLPNPRGLTSFVTRIMKAPIVLLLLCSDAQTLAFNINIARQRGWVVGINGTPQVRPGRVTPPTTTSSSWRMSSSSSTDAPPDTGFIATELRGAAMKLHTTQQAPKEGKVVVEEPKEKYITTHEDYLAFLVDSKHVYEALEDIVNQRHELSQFRNTGLERTKALELDIKFMVKEYGLKKPEVGEFGRKYAAELRAIESIPEFLCHFYNFYFAHTAGGRMIGKQMAALLLDKKTLEFYKVRPGWCLLCTLRLPLPGLTLLHHFSGMVT
jgi:hypothetical protein